MALTSLFAFVSTALAVYSLVPYVQAILNKKTIPHQFTWFVFFIMNGIVFFSQFLAGARASVLISFTFFISSFIIFLLSLKFGIRDSSRFDKVLLVFALIIIGIWVLTKNNAIAIWLSVVIDVLATSMMMLKINANPFSEEPSPWSIAAVAYLFTCLTLVEQPVNVLFVRPVYGLLVCSLIVFFIFFKRKRVGAPAIETPHTLPL